MPCQLLRQGDEIFRGKSVGEAQLPSIAEPPNSSFTLKVV